MYYASLRGSAGLHRLAFLSFYFFYLMEYTLDKLQEAAFTDVLRVYEVFQNHFGKDFVDLQDMPSSELLAQCGKGCVTSDGLYKLDDRGMDSFKEHFVLPSILVWWPKVTVTNEHDCSVEIQDLYARITINGCGCIPYESVGFTLNRATYSAKQFQSNYMHSHINGIPKYNLSKFQSPCLGTGPIKNTIVSLKTQNDTVLWMLFCEELSRYVTVESLHGVPYMRLENIGKDDADTYDYHNRYTYFNHDPIDRMVDRRSFTSEQVTAAYAELDHMLRDFIAYYLQHGHFTFNYEQGQFVQGMSHFDYIMDISNAFIDYYNTYLADDADKVQYYSGIGLFQMVLADGMNFKVKRNASPLPSGSYIGSHICTFKGKDITLDILGQDNNETQMTLVLNEQLAMVILQNILRIVNFRYINKHGKNNNDRLPSGSAESSAYTHQKVRYL